jgi:hypothetical protein
MRQQDHSARSGPAMIEPGSGLAVRLLAMAREPESRFLYLLPFGIPTLVIAEDPQLLAAAAATYTHWSAEAPFAEPALELRLEIGDATSMGVCLDIRVEGSRLNLSGKGASGTADAASGKADAIVPAELARDAAGFAEVTDTLLLFLLARRGRTPVHAAAFILEDMAILLAGPSGSGKSTLALAAAREGFPILSDDMVFVQRDPGVTVWGFPRPIHVFPEDAAGRDYETRLRNNKLKAVVGNPAAAVHAERARLVLLERGRELALREIDPSEAVDDLMRLDAGFDLLERESRSAVQALASSGVWRLTLSKDPSEAIAFLVSRLPLEPLLNTAVDNPR